MGLPTYFNQLPKLNYLTTISATGVPAYTQLPNIFKLPYMQDDIFKYAAMYYTYTIKDGQRPEDVARLEYGDAGLYWIVLHVNNIVDPYQQWPIPSWAFEDYLVEKYGGWSAAGATSHYETVETRNAAGDIVLPGGIIVDSDFIYYYHHDPFNKVIDGGDYVLQSSLPVSVSYATVESRNNVAKCNINLLDRRYVNSYIKYFRDAVGQLDVHASFDYYQFENF